MWVKLRHARCSVNVGCPFPHVVEVNLRPLFVRLGETPPRPHTPPGIKQREPLRSSAGSWGTQRVRLLGSEYGVGVWRRRFRITSVVGA